MEKTKRTPYVPISKEKQAETMQRLKMSVKYDMFTTFSDADTVDDKIISLSDYDFSKMTKVYKNRIDYYDALSLAEDYVGNGKDVPEILWKNIQKVRKDYILFIKN